MVTGTSVASRLKAMDAKWGKAAAQAKEEGGFATLPDAQYIARFESGTIADSGGGLRMKTLWVVLEGDSEGEVITKSDGMEGEKSDLYAAKFFGRLGYDPEEIKPSQFEKLLKELAKTKPVGKLQLKTTGDFQNVYLNGILPDYDSDGDGEEDGEEDGDSIEEGSRVTFTRRGKADAGEVTEVIDEDTVKVKLDSTGKIVTLKVEDLEKEDSEDDEDSDDEDDDEDDDEEDDESSELAVGGRVELVWKGVAEEGEVTKIMEAEGKARVKLDSTGKEVTAKIESLTAVEDDETDNDEDDEDSDDEDDEEEEEVKPAKRGAKTPPASSKASAKSGASTAKGKTPVATSKPAGRVKK